MPTDLIQSEFRQKYVLGILNVLIYVDYPGDSLKKIFLRMDLDGENTDFLFIKTRTLEAISSELKVRSQNVD